MTTLEVSFQDSIGDLQLDVHFLARAGTTLALLGPNGSGKSTVLKAVAGLAEIARGTISFGSETWSDPVRKIHLPPRQRGVGFVFQRLALFPSMNVLDNVMYGSRRRMPPASAAGEALELLDRFGLRALASRDIESLSGGEAQAVAIARALLPKPRVLLLDEPLSSLDTSKRAAARRLLRSTLREFEGVRIIVTHDPLEAGALADEVAILENGRVVQGGRLEDIALHPRSPFAAALAGVNFFTGRIERRGESVELVSGSARLVVSTDLGEGSDVLATVHPHSILLSLDAPRTSARNVIGSRVSDIDRWKDKVRIRLTGDLSLTAEVTPAAVSELGLMVGSSVFAAIKATEIEVYPA